jgi:hypothetical protein
MGGEHYRALAVRNSVEFPSSHEIDILMFLKVSSLFAIKVSCYRSYSGNRVTIGILYFIVVPQ